MDMQEKAYDNQFNLDCINESKYDDAMVDLYMMQQPVLTDEENFKEIEKLNTCADYILKRRIEPNLDSIY